MNFPLSLYPSPLKHPLPSGDYYFWIPIVGPHIGAILGALVYIFVIEMHHPIDTIRMSIPLEDKV